MWSISEVPINQNPSRGDDLTNKKTVISPTKQQLPVDLKVSIIWLLSQGSYQRLICQYWFK